MTCTIEERILVYDALQLERWCCGDKSLIPGFVTVASDVHNQPDYWFGEMFTLAWFHEHEGWLGFASYAIGPQYPGSPKRAEGRARLEQIIPPNLLAKLRTLRLNEPRGSGEPDLFLYKPDGSFKFAEVKKKTDRLSEAQLTCIAEILAVLNCPVDIVYLRESRQRYRPKRYEFDLARRFGKRAG